MSRGGRQVHMTQWACTTVGDGGQIRKALYLGVRLSASKSLRSLKVSVSCCDSCRRTSLTLAELVHITSCNLTN